MGVSIDGRSESAVIADLQPAYDRFLRSVGLAISLSKDGLSAADAPRLADITMAPENKSMRDSNVREIARSDALRLAEAVLSAA